MVLGPTLLPEFYVVHVDTRADSLPKSLAPEVRAANFGIAEPVKYRKVAMRNQGFADR